MLTSFLLASLPAFVVFGEEAKRDLSHLEERGWAIVREVDAKTPESQADAMRRIYAETKRREDIDVWRLAFVGSKVPADEIAAIHPTLTKERQREFQSLTDWDSRIAWLDAHGWRNERVPDESKVPPLKFGAEGRRATLDFFERNVYGKRPVERPDGLSFRDAAPPEDSFGGIGTKRTVEISWPGTCRPGSFTATVWTPKGRKRPCAAFVLVGLRDIVEGDGSTHDSIPVRAILERGFAVAAFRHRDVAPDWGGEKPHDGFASGVYPCFEKPEDRTSESWGAISAWAWGMSRVLDFLETLPEVDSKCVMAVGLSRGGKTALWAAATDERFAGVCASGSGCCGAAMNAIFLPGEDLNRIHLRFPYWFCGNFAAIAKSKEQQYPGFDQHQMLSLIAPRRLYVSESTHDTPRFADFEGVRLSAPAWTAFGFDTLAAAKFPGPGRQLVEGRMGFHLRYGLHDLTLEDWNRYMDFAARQFASARSWGRPDPEAQVAELRIAKKGTDVVRLGDTVRFEVTGGGRAKPTTYEILSSEQIALSPPQVVAEMTFGEAWEKRPLEIKGASEGVFRLTARVKGAKNPLNATAFSPREYAVVDTSGAIESSAAPVLVHEIDCAAQTVDGRPLTADEFFEANSPTHVSRCAAGAYRESGIGPDRDLTFQERCSTENFPSFAYHLELPADLVQKPVRIQVVFPDDAERNVAVIPTWLDGRNGDFYRHKQGAKINNSYGKAYRTGGEYPLSGAMHSQDFLVWAATTNLMVPFISQQPGKTAAAAKVRLWRFEGDRVPFSRGRPGGRMVGQWSEEAQNWRLYVNIDKDLYSRFFASTFVAYERWAQFIRYHNANVMGSYAFSYCNSNWRSRTPMAVDWQHPDFDEVRLAALVCEKYGINLSLDIFRASEKACKTEFPARSPDPSAVWDFDGYGSTSIGNTDIPQPDPTSAVVQDAWLETFGEMMDVLSGTKSLRAVTCRTMTWFFRSDFFFGNMTRGYGDRTVADFERATGLKVPGEPGDPARFAKRMAFLTSPAVIERWRAWRCGEIEKYWRRMRGVLNSGESKDVAFVVMASGDFITQRGVQLPATALERALDCGISADMLSRNDLFGWCVPTEEPGRASFMRQFRYPCGYASSSLGLREQNWYPAVELGARGGARWDKSRFPVLSTVFIPAGRNSLHALAKNLADADARLFYYGSNSDHYGDLDLWRDFLKALERLPDERFEDTPDSGDSVVVRTFARGGRRWLYAVNRSRESVKTRISLACVGSPVDLSSGAPVAVPQGGLYDLELGGYGLFAVEGEDLDAPGDVFSGLLKDERVTNWEIQYTSVMPELGKDGATGSQMRPSSSFAAEWTGQKVLMAKDGEVAFDVATFGEGEYSLELGLASDVRCDVRVFADGVELSPTVAIPRGRPWKCRFDGLRWRGGKVRVAVKGEGPFGVYAWRIAPKMRPIPGRLWSVIGGFKPQEPETWPEGPLPSYVVWEKKVYATYDTNYVDVARVDTSVSYDDGYGGSLSWRFFDYPGMPFTDYPVVGMSARIPGWRPADVNYEAVELVADRDCEIPVSVAADWDAFVFLNGERVKSSRNAEKPIADFGWWRYVPTGTLKLRKGVNTLMIKHFNGRFGSAFAGWIGDAPGIEVRTPAGREAK